MSARGLRIFVVLLTIMGVSLAGWQAAPAAPDVTVVIIPAGSPIQIAVASWYGYASYKDQFKAVQMAIDDYGAIKGFTVQKNEYDEGCSEPGGSAVGAAIVANPQNIGVIGPMCSSSSVGALPLFENAELVMLSPSNTNQTLPTYGPNAFNRLVVYDPYFEEYWIATINALPNVQTWEEQFNTLHGYAPDVIARFAYDATTLLLTRIDQVSSLSSGDLTINRQALATAVRATFNFSGVTGRITLDRNGNRVDGFREVVWDDSFASTSLNSRWSWINEDPAGWSLTAKPGYLRLTALQAMQRLVQPAPKGNYEIGTVLNFEPTQNYQGAGLVLYYGSDYHLSLIRAYCDAPPPACQGNAIYFDRVEGGSFYDNFATVLPVSNLVHLRLVREGNSYTGYASTNGTQWQLIGTHTPTFTPTHVGLAAGNDMGTVPANLPADFDYFVLEYDANLIYLPMLFR